MISLTTKEEIYHNRQKNMLYMQKEFDNNDKKQQKVRDHYHYTGKYRGVAHNICNFRYKVVFHNDSTCDYFYNQRVS